MKSIFNETIYFQVNPPDIKEGDEKQELTEPETAPVDVNAKPKAGMMNIVIESTT